MSTITRPLQAIASLTEPTDLITRDDKSGAVRGFLGSVLEACFTIELTLPIGFVQEKPGHLVKSHFS